ncbi:hypothetical protein FO519_007815 [Halicephalobus sp. NKZ332]|nr:hypothetical protein FO519_007815 [Halicephalobus sp. NKZ332]
MNGSFNPRFDPGDVIEDFFVEKKLKEGASSTIFLVGNRNDEKIKNAMKVGSYIKLEKELFVLKKLQKSRHVCRLIASGEFGDFSFFIMTLLWKDLSELRRRMPERKMPLAIRDVHEAGFIHGDVKPTSFACGYIHKHVIYIFDFELARQIVFFDKDGNPKLREPREKVCFRKATRYSSLNFHQGKEQGRHDDVISLVFVLIELLTGTLPWKGHRRAEAAKLKEASSDKDLFEKCPNFFKLIFDDLRKLTYFGTPSYDFYENLMKTNLKKIGTKSTDLFEWEQNRKSRKNNNITRKYKEFPVKRKSNDVTGNPEDFTTIEGEDIGSQEYGSAEDVDIVEDLKNYAIIEEDVDLEEHGFSQGYFTVPEDVHFRKFQQHGK